MYTGMSYILRASRRPCGMYKAGRWLCAPSDSELGTRNSELGVPLGSAEHGGRVAGDLRGTLDVDPNPNGILPLHLLVTLNTDPRSVIAQWSEREREWWVGPCRPALKIQGRAGGSSKGESVAELMDMTKRVAVSLPMFIGICTSLVWTDLARQAGPVHFIGNLSTPLRRPGTPSSKSDACSGGGFREFRQMS